jgi:1-acyl-sn-glycerol-3-phosphate acyltransferase
MAFMGAEAKGRMTKKLAFAARVLGSGFGFAVFGAVALLLGFVVIPIASALERDPVKQQLRAQRILHHSARPYLALVRRMRIFSVITHGAQRLNDPGPQLVVANHPTLLDIVVLVSLMPQADCIINVDRASNAFLRRLISASGHIANDGGRNLLVDCRRWLGLGRMLIIFPVGT